MTSSIEIDKTVDFTVESPFWNGLSYPDCIFYCHCGCGGELPKGSTANFLQGHGLRTAENRQITGSRMHEYWSDRPKDPTHVSNQLESQNIFWASGEGRELAATRVERGSVRSARQTAENYRRASEGVVYKKSSLTHKELWKSPIWVEKRLRDIQISPNFTENYLLSLLDEYYPGKWGYNGDGSRTLLLHNTLGYGGSKVPDFVRLDGKKQVIFSNGTYWHSVRDDTEENQKSDLEQFGIECTVIDADSWEDVLYEWFFCGLKDMVV